MKVIHYFLFLILFVWTQSINSQIVVESFDKSINTSQYEEIGPILSKDGSTLYFTRVASPDFIRRYTASPIGSGEKSLHSIFSEFSGKDVKDISSSPYNQDIWVAKIDRDMNVQYVQHPDYPLNNAFPNSVCAILPEENSLIVINQFGSDGSIEEGFSKVKIDGINNYRPPVGMDIHNYYDEGENVNLTISRDGQHIFISMERNDGKGMNDLYVAVKVGDNKWTEPKLLNDAINTPYNETSPFLTPDKKTLFFSSSKPGGAGGQDLYMSQRLDYSYRSWSKPVRLEEPINGPAHDFLAYLSDDGRYLLFNSTRNGSSDIFYIDFERSDILKRPLQVNVIVVDASTGELTRAQIHHGYAANDKYEGFFNSYNGQYSIELRRNQPYIFDVRKRGYVDKSVIINPLEKSSVGIESDTIIIEMEPWNSNSVASFPAVKKSDITKEYQKKKEPESKYPFTFDKQNKVVLSEIYFEKSTPYVLSKSINAIEKLVEMMNDFPSMEILIIGHTDNVGGKDALKKLSETRANAIKNYCVAYGIEESRIHTIGKGASEPLNANSTEEEKQQNRRVEIEILKE